MVPLGYTFCHVFVDKGTAFEEGREISLKKILAPGRTQMLMLIEGGQPVPWTKPEDIPFGPDKPLPKLNTVFQDGTRVSTCDGSSYFLDAQTSDEVIRAAITGSGGKRTPLEDGR